MAVEHDQIRSVLTREVEPQAPLHSREQPHRGPQGDDSFDQPEIRQVVLDVEDQRRALDLVRTWRTRGRGRRPEGLDRRRHHWQDDGEGAADGDPALHLQRPAHDLNEML